jgi:hypothetical protein
MLVDVVVMRRRGEKRPREEVLATPPVRGELQLHNLRPGTTYWRGKERPLLAGLLQPGVMEWALPPLDYARVTHINDRGMLIVGFEEIARANNRGADVFRQAWWARPVTDSAGAPAPARDRTDPPAEPE